MLSHAPYFGIMSPKQLYNFPSNSTSSNAQRLPLHASSKSRRQPISTQYWSDHEIPIKRIFCSKKSEFQAASMPLAPLGCVCLVLPASVPSPLSRRARGLRPYLLDKIVHPPGDHGHVVQRLDPGAAGPGEVCAAGPRNRRARPARSATAPASVGSTVSASGPQTSDKPPRPDVTSAAPLASASSAVRPNGSGVLVRAIPTAARCPGALHLGVRQISVDPHPCAERRERRRAARARVSGSRSIADRMKRALQSRPRRQDADDRRHRLAVALVVERASDRENRLVLCARARPVAHVEAVGDGAHRRAGAGKILPEAREAILADEGETRRGGLISRARSARFSAPDAGFS